MSYYDDEDGSESRLAWRRECAAIGAAEMDLFHPGWENRIDKSSLNISSSCNCILGQAVGSYNKGLESLSGGTGESSTDRGFCGPSHRPDECKNPRRREEGVALREAWITEIDKRLTSKEVQS